MTLNSSDYRTVTEDLYATAAARRFTRAIWAVRSACSTSAWAPAWKRSS